MNRKNFIFDKSNAWPTKLSIFLKTFLAFLFVSLIISPSVKVRQVDKLIFLAVEMSITSVATLFPICTFFSYF
jgi:hypothetical protein